MRRNREVNLNELPKIDIHRSIFPYKFGHKTSFNVGELIPYQVIEVIPGSTYSLKTSCVVRLQTLKTPLMDNMYMDTYNYFVPMRLVFDKTAQLFGENDQGPWTMDKIDYRIPYLQYPLPHSEGDTVDTTHGFDEGSIADYMGVPININSEDFADGHSDKDYPMVLPFRAYALIVNEFFRDQNLQQPIAIHKDDQIREGITRAKSEAKDDWYVTDLELGGKPFVAARFHNYFSSCLPAPQKSPDVSIFGGFANDSLVNNYNTDGPFAPVYTTNSSTYGSRSGLQLNDLYSLRVFDTTAGTIPNSTIIQTRSTEQYPAEELSNLVKADPTSVTTHRGIVPMNLWANLNIPDATISNLRLAFQLQRYFEAQARNGTRYREYLAGFFGVYNGDARMQVPEYLGGHRFPLTVHQIANTSESDNAKLGDLGAMSNTSDVHDDIHMSFTEHGFIISLCVVRYDNTFSQGLERMWSRRTALDYYNPIFANISDQPVYKREISLGLKDLVPGEGTTPVERVQTPDEVFGYAPAWQEYRVKPSRVSAEMRPEAQLSLASWHLADDYDVAPTLDAEWIQTDKNIVDRVLDVTSEVSNQVFADFYVSGKAVLPMPVHSIPGLADHH